MNYLPFDLETALKHPERVVTRDGRKVTQLTKFEAKADYPLIGVIGTEMKSWDINGLYAGDNISKTDLFLLPEVKECWVNVYDNGVLYAGARFTTEKEAIEFGINCHTYIKTIRITNEPE